LQGPGDDPVHKAAFNHYSKECLVAAGGKDKEPMAVYSDNTVEFILLYKIDRFESFTAL
jgi:hypothetical protein